MTMYSLALEGRTKRIWQAQSAGGQWTVVAGTEAKPSAPAPAASEEALYKAMLAKLRAGYALAEPSGALVGLLGLRSGTLSIGLSPDGAKVWQALRETETGARAIRIFALASGVMLAEHVLDDIYVRQLWVLPGGRALVSTDSHGVLELAEDGTHRPWSRAIESPSKLEVVGDRVVVCGRDEVVLLDASSAAVIARIAGVDLAALSADGARMAVAGGNVPEVRVLDARTGDEQMRLSLGKGRGARALAISHDRVVAADIYFEGAGRHATWCWALADGERILTKRFANENNDHHSAAVFGAEGALLALAHASGYLEVLEGADVRFDTGLLRHLRYGGDLRSIAGRWLLGTQHTGVVAVWDFERVRAGQGGSERAEQRAVWAAIEHAPSPVAVAMPRTRIEPTAAEWQRGANDEPGSTAEWPRGAIAALEVPLGRAPWFHTWLPGGAIYVAHQEAHSTFVDLSAWPPSVERRTQVVHDAARGPKQQWLIHDRDGLWLTDDFAVQGRALAPPFPPAKLGWLGDAPIVFDAEGIVPPQVHAGAGWTPITGLVKADAHGGTSVIKLADGTDLVTFRGAAYRVDGAHRATRVLDLTGFAPHEAVPLPDGRFALHRYQALCVFGLDGARVELGDATQNKRSWGPYALGPQGGVLVSFASWRDAKTIAGAYLDLVTDTPVLIEKARFGVADDAQLAELFACGDRILARIAETSTFRAIPWPLAPPLVRIPRQRRRS